MKVVVVDDNKIELREISRLVEHSQLELEVVGRFINGKDAYEYIMENEVDIVISDVQMPVMDGIELLYKLNQNRKMTEFIFISCYDDFDYIRSALKNDAYDYILKPIDKKEFMLVLQALCEKCTLKKGMDRAREEVGKKLERYQKIMEEESLRLLFWGSYDLESGRTPELIRFSGLSRVTVVKGRIVDVICVKEDATWGENRTWIINLVKHQIEELERDELKVYAIIMSQIEITVVLVEENNFCDIEEELIQFKQKMANDLGILLSFGISNQDKSMDGVTELYRQATETLEFTYGSRKSIVLKYEDIAINNYEDIDTCSIFANVKKIIERGDKESVNLFLDYYLGAELNRQSRVKEYAYAVLYSVEMILLEYGCSLNEIIEKDIWKKMNSFDTILNPTQWLCNMLNVAIDSIHIKEENILDDRVNLVNKIKHIIKEKYSGKLTVGMIAEELHYSGKHISEIFLEVEKKSIFEYLTEYRMEVAKNMLKDPDSKIYMVVESVGYKRKTHFYDVFKSYVGITPMEYKKLYARERIQ